MAKPQVKLGEPVPGLQDPDRLRLLGGEIEDLRLELEDQHTTYFNDISCWWSWYHAVPDTSWRNNPYDGASNLVMPVIMSQADPFVARTLLQMLSTATFWSGSAESDEWRELAPSMFELLNWSVYHQPASGVLDTLEPGICEQQVIGETIWSQEWVDRKKPVLTPTGKVQLLSFGAGPALIHRPRERYLFPRTTMVQDAEVVFIQDFYSWNQLCNLAQSDPHVIKSQFDGLASHAGLDGPGAQLDDERRARSGIAPHRSGGRFEPHDVRRVMIDTQLADLLAATRGLPRPNHIRGQDIDETPTPIELTYHPKSGRVLKAIYSPYLLADRPLYMASRKRGGSSYEAGRGLSKDLEQLQRLESTMVNQANDSVTIGNSVKLFTNDRNLENKRWQPNRFTFTPDPEKGLKEFGASVKNVMPEMTLLQAAHSMVERIGGAAEAVQGRESRMGGHPSPATNYLGQIQQSQINSSRSLKSLREALSRVGLHRALMYQQFETNKGNWITTQFGVEDATRILKYLSAATPLHGHVDFDIHPLSEIHNPDAERQKAITIYQMVSNHTVTIAKLNEGARAAEMQGDPTQAQWLRSSVKALTKSAQLFLEAAEVDDWEDYVGVIQQSSNASLDALRQLAPTAGGPGGPPGGGPPGQPVAGGPSVPPPGVASLFGQGGSPPPGSNGGGGGFGSQ
jgi:hypothetical protein